MKLKLSQSILLVHLYTPHPQSKQINLNWLGMCDADEENGRDYIFNSS